MNVVRLHARPDPAVAPDFFQVIADTSFVTETRLLDWNLGSDTPTALFSVTGDREAFRERVESTRVAHEWECTPIDADRFYFYVRIDPVPLLARVIEMFTTAGVIVTKPIVYRDGTVRARLLGHPDRLQRVLDAVPDAISVEVRSVSATADRSLDAAASLTDRQRETLEAALAAGYFDRPRTATQADVADRLGCSSSTASEHLQKAIATLVRRAIADDPGEG